MILYIREKLEWARMKRVAFDHPFFDRKAHVLTEHEAERILRKHMIPNGAEVLRRARIECNLPDSIPTQKGDEARHKAINPRTYRGLVALAAILILVGFFMFTKVGTALAHAAYEIIVQILDGTFVTRNNKIPDEVDSIDFSSLPSEFASLEDVAHATGRPVLFPSDESTLVSFSTVVLGSEMIVVNSTYISGEGKQYTLVQTIHNDDSLWSGAIDLSGELETIVLPVGITVYIGQMEDGAVFAQAYSSGLDLNISSIDLTLQEMRDLVEEIQLIQ